MNVSRHECFSSDHSSSRWNAEFLVDDATAATTISDLGSS